MLGHNCKTRVASYESRYCHGNLNFLDAFQRISKPWSYTRMKVGTASVMAQQRYNNFEVLEQSPKISQSLRNYECANTREPTFPTQYVSQPGYASMGGTQAQKHHQVKAPLSQTRCKKGQQLIKMMAWCY